MIWKDIEKRFKPTDILNVDGKKVWDYKIDGTTHDLHLILDEEGVSEENEAVTVGEISEYLKDNIDVQVRSESDGTTITLDRIICN